MLLARVRRALRQAADPARAPAMQAYMKSALPYHGVAAAPLREVCRETFAGAAFGSAAQWRAQVLELWQGARFREERYAALYLAGDRRAREFQTPAAMSLYFEPVPTSAAHPR